MSCALSDGVKQFEFLATMYHSNVVARHQDLKAKIDIARCRCTAKVVLAQTGSQQTKSSQKASELIARWMIARIIVAA